MTEGFEEFLRERREHTERTRRLLIGVLGVTCVALAVSNVVLALRLTAVRARPAAEAPAPSASVPSRAEEPPSRVTLPPAGLPSATSPPDEPPRPATPLPIVREGPSPVIEPTLAPAAPEDVTAAWMLTTYGRAGAEARAQAALEFYDTRSAEGRYWQRVLAEIAAAR